MRHFGFQNKYPYTDFSQINLDWVENTIIELKEMMQTMNDAIPSTITEIFKDMLEDGTIQASFTITVHNEEMTISQIIVREV